MQQIRSKCKVHTRTTVTKIWAHTDHQSNNRTGENNQIEHIAKRTTSIKQKVTRTSSEDERRTKIRRSNSNSRNERFELKWRKDRSFPRSRSSRATDLKRKGVDGDVEGRLPCSASCWRCREWDLQWSHQRPRWCRRRKDCEKPYGPCGRRDCRLHLPSSVERTRTRTPPSLLQKPLESSQSPSSLSFSNRRRRKTECKKKWENRDGGVGVEGDESSRARSRYKGVRSGRRIFL